MKNSDHDNDDLTSDSPLDDTLATLVAERVDLDRRLDALALARETMDEFDPDQTRGEGGRWSKEGGGGGGGGSKEGNFSGRLKPTPGTHAEKLAKVEQAISGVAPREVAPKEPSAGLKAIGESLGKDYKHTDPTDGKPASAAAPTQTSVEPKTWHGKAKGYTQTEEAFKKDGKYPPDRVANHNAYANKAIPKDLPKSKEPTFHMTGGGFASGKTSALIKNEKTDIPGTDKAAHLSADDARHFIPEYKQGVKAKDPTAATFVQEEASFAAKQALQKAIKAGHDTVYDSSGDSGVDSLEEKINQYRSWGVKNVVANYATLDVDEAIKRSDDRAKQEGPDKGRFISHAYLRANHVNVAQTVLGAIDRKLFDKLDVWSNDSTIGHPPGTKDPIHLATFTKTGGLKVHDAEGWEKFKGRAKGAP